MSSSRAASLASIASTVKFDGYLDRLYDSNMKEAEQAYAAHLRATEELHQAQMNMMRRKRAIRTLNDELSNATAAAADATELVDRKRKAAAAAAQDFELATQLTRDCYGTEAKRSKKAPEAAPPPANAGSKVVDAAKLNKVAAIEHESQDPYDAQTHNPTSPRYAPRFDPVSPSHWPASPSYVPNSPIYVRATSYEPTSPICKPCYSATSPTYTPNSPPPSPHAVAAAKRSALKWGA